MNEMRLNKARLNVVSLNKALINGAVERHGSSAGGGGAPSKYIRFADPAVEAVLMANGVSSDGVGITKDDAAAVTSIGTWFRENANITSFDELKYFVNVTELKDYAFYKCSNLQSVHVGNIKKLNGSAFRECAALNQDINMPLLEEMGVMCFDRSGIKTFSAPLLKNIVGYSTSGSAFFECQNLTKVVIPSAERIGAWAFRFCEALTELVINQSLIKAIENGALNGCSSLSIDHLNIENCIEFGYKALELVKVRKINLSSVSVLPISGSNYQNYGDKSTLEEIILSDNVTAIPDYSFRQYTKLSSLAMNKSAIVSIGAAAFWDVPLSGDMSFASLTSLGENAFRNTDIESFTAPNVAEIKYDTFNNCSNLKKVDFGAITAIGGRAFYGCTAMEKMIIRTTTPPALEDVNAFNNTNNCPIYVPDAALEVYKTATNWSQYQDRIHPLSELEGSPYITFADAEVERVLMENNVSSDGVGITMADAQAVTDMENTFYGNTEIRSFNELEYFSNLESLGTFMGWPSAYGTFNGCTNLKSVKLPPSVKKLGAYAFKGCTSLEDVGDLTHVENIGGDVFTSCQSLAIVVNMPNLKKDFAGIECKASGITGLGELGEGFLEPFAFENCPNFEFAIMPSSVSNLTWGMFWNCPKFRTIVMRNTIPCSLGEFPSSLASIYVPDSALDTYKAASGWINYADKIKPMSDITSDELYEKIQDYL